MLFNVNIQEYKIEQEKLKQVLLILRTKNMFKVYTKESKPKANLAHYVRTTPYVGLSQRQRGS
jgi:hypothetical protein